MNPVRFWRHPVCLLHLSSPNKRMLVKCMLINSCLVVSSCLFHQDQVSSNYPISLSSFRWNVIFRFFDKSEVYSWVYVYDTCKDFGKIIVSSNYGVKESSRSPLFRSVKIDRFPITELESRVQRRMLRGRSVHSRAILFLPPPPLLTRIIAAFLRAFCGLLWETRWPKIPLGPCHRVHSPLGRELETLVRGAPSPKNGSNWSFPFSRVMPVSRSKTPPAVRGRGTGSIVGRVEERRKQTNNGRSILFLRKNNSV